MCEKEPIVLQSLYTLQAKKNQSLNLFVKSKNLTLSVFAGSWIINQHDLFTCDFWKIQGKALSLRSDFDFSSLDLRMWRNW